MGLKSGFLYSASFVDLPVVTEQLIVHYKETEEKGGRNLSKAKWFFGWVFFFFLKNGFSSVEGKASEPFGTLRKCLLLLLQRWDVPLRLTLLRVFQWIYEQTITFLMLLLRNWVNNSRRADILRKTEKYLTAWYLTKKVSLKLTQAI